MPLGLLALVSTLRKNHIKASVYQPAHKIFMASDFLIVAEQILKLNPDFIGFSTWCNTFPTSLLLAKQIKQINPHTTIIFGGPQVSILPVEIIKEFNCVDFILEGEADLTLPLLLKELKKNGNHLAKIPGLTYRNKYGEVIQNKNSTIVANLDELPIPAYDLIPNTKVLKLDVGRGCPFHCTYCTTSNFFSKKHRIKSAERIIEEMDLAYEQDKKSSFSFAHDLFTLNKNFVFDFCKKLINHCRLKDRRIEWTCSARTDCVSSEMLTQMKNAGCHSIFFGIESGSEKIQKSIKKNLNLQIVLKIAETCRVLGLKMHASFILGFPDETEEDIEKTLELMIKLACEGVQIQISELSLLPGTPLFQSYKNELKFDGTFSNHSMAILGKNEIDLIKRYPDIFSSFYFLPVKSISRESIVVLTRILNILGKFTNTLFLIKNDVKSDIEEYNLLHIFLQNIQELKKQLLSDNPVSLLITNLLRLYLNNKYGNKIPVHIKEVFEWESIQNLLKGIYQNWNLVNPDLLKNNFNCNYSKNNIRYLIAPSWNTLFSIHDLNKIIPEKNGWITDIETIPEKGKLYYLVTAISEKSCKLLKIDYEEFELLRILKQESFNDFLKKVDSKFNRQRSEEFILKLKNSGVLYEQRSNK